MKKATVHIVSVILGLCVFLGDTKLTMAAQNKNVEGYITIAFSDNSFCNYPAKLSGEEIYVSAEDIAEITGYTYELGEFMAFTRPYGLEYATAVSVELNGKTEAMGKQYQIDIVEENGTYFLPLEKMLYLTHATWCVDENILYVERMQKTIIDFIGEYQLSLLENRTSQGELLLNGENNLTRATRSTLAHVVRNFDARLYVPVVGTLILEEEQYEEILMELAKDDIEFLGETGQKNIEGILQESIFEELSSDLGKIEFLTNDIPEIADNLQEILEKEAQNSRIAEKIVRNVNLSDLSSSEIEAISKELKGISNVTSAIIATKNIVEAAKWIEEADEEVLQEISVLSDFDDTQYNTFLTNPMKQAAKNLLNRKQNTGVEVVDDLLMETINFLGKQADDVTFVGKFIGAIQTVDMLGGIFSDRYTNAMDVAELSFRANYLIKTETVALNEELKAYYKVNSGNFSLEELQRLRSSVMLSLRLNLRAKANIYYINVLGNDEGQWKESEEAQRIQQLISEDYAMLIALKSTEAEDKVLILEDFKDMYQNEDGITREKLSPDILRTVENPQEIRMTATLDEAYNAYVNACDLTTASGNWKEDVEITIDMDISDASTKAHYVIDAGATTNVFNYQKTGTSALKLQGTGYMNFANISYKWNMDYANGIAHYEYTEPNSQSSDIETEPDFFEFYEYEKSMWKDFELKKNQITFTIDGEQMTEKGLAIISSLVNMDKLQYSDVRVAVSLDETTEKIQEMKLEFQASLEFQGYDADAKYQVLYRFQ